MKKQAKQVESASEIVVDKYSNVKTVNLGNLSSKCHVFKLLPTAMLRNISPFKNDPLVINIEHCHIFRNYDSYGREQKTTNAVGGHYHEIELREVNGEWKNICSPPKSNKGSNELLANDKHTHEFQYLHTGIVKIREINEEAMKLVNDAMAKEA